MVPLVSCSCRSLRTRLQQGWESVHQPCRPERWDAAEPRSNLTSATCSLGQRSSSGWLLLQGWLTERRTHWLESELTDWTKRGSKQDSRPSLHGSGTLQKAVRAEEGLSEVEHIQARYECRPLERTMVVITWQASHSWGSLDIPGTSQVPLLLWGHMGS